MCVCDVGMHVCMCAENKDMEIRKTLLPWPLQSTLEHYLSFSIQLGLLVPCLHKDVALTSAGGSLPFLGCAQPNAAPSDQ